MEKILILHIPVIHKGFLDFLESVKREVSKVYLIDEDLQTELSEMKPDIAAIDSAKAKELLSLLGFNDVSVLSGKGLSSLKGKPIILVQNEISRNLKEKYLQNENIEWRSVFLRWDKEKVMADLPAGEIISSTNEFDMEMMQEAYKEAAKSGDWWRQIGAVAVQGKEIVARSYNQGVPTDNSPYQLGSIRDLFKAGEKQDLSPTIHAEQKLISEAAKEGIKLAGASLYLTHYPCPVCAKLIAYSGIKKIYFKEGASNLDGQRVLDSAGVEVIHIA